MFAVFSGVFRTQAMNQTTEQKIDCVVRVVTPENIEFEYMLAGPFQRLPAFIIDFVLRTVLFFAAIIFGALIGIPALGTPVASIFLGLLAFFLLSWLYGTLMEAHFNGRTVGKILIGLRVISSDGRPINGSQAALRNLLRLSDLMPPLSLTLIHPDAPPANIIPTFFVGLLTMTLTTRMQRLGDLAAGTMVVWDGRRGKNVNLQPEDARAYSLAELIPPTFQISRTLARAIALYMERRRFLSPARRHEIANNLAQPLLALFELQRDTSSDLLLCAMYVRIYHSAGQRAAKLAAVRAVQQAHGLPHTQYLPPRSAAYEPVTAQVHPSPLTASVLPQQNMSASGTATVDDMDPSSIIVASAIELEDNARANRSSITGTGPAESNITGAGSWTETNSWTAEKRAEP